MGNLGGGLRSIDWSSQKLERFEKNFYVEDKRISALSEREVEEFRRSKDIKVRILIQVLVCFFFFDAFSRFKGVESHGQYAPSTKLLSQNTSCPPFVPRDSPRQHQFNVRHGQWH